MRKGAKRRQALFWPRATRAPDSGVVTPGGACLRSECAQRGRAVDPWKRSTTHRTGGSSAACQTRHGTGPPQDSLTPPGRRPPGPGAASGTETRGTRPLHRRTTGPEITEQAGPELGAVYVPVSTGGALAGISAHLRRHRPDVAAVAVDVHGSPAVAGSAGRRLLPGIGASRPSAFLKGPCGYDRAVHVDDIEAIAYCRILAEDVGLVLGGSSGFVVRALLTDLENGRMDDRLAVCLAADDSGKYRDTLYCDDWATEQGVVKEITAAVEQLRREGLFFNRKHQEH
ncbi:pyridoxal-phosphate dependent enzyme [Streptomyces sp. NPDC059970]|uniref:pyridoxal-phosphate dependent enzyme n=1 Tax=Streptomyces sp. NPDC059970 TaxID=3347019 RepID=UPI0036BF8C49